MHRLAQAASSAPSAASAASAASSLPASSPYVASTYSPSTYAASAKSTAPVTSPAAFSSVGYCAGTDEGGQDQGENGQFDAPFAAGRGQLTELVHANLDVKSDGKLSADGAGRHSEAGHLPQAASGGASGAMDVESDQAPSGTQVPEATDATHVMHATHATEAWREESWRFEAWRHALHPERSANATADAATLGQDSLTRRVDLASQGHQGSAGGEGEGEEGEEVAESRRDAGARSKAEFVTASSPRRPSVASPSVASAAPTTYATYTSPHPRPPAAADTSEDNVRDAPEDDGGLKGTEGRQGVVGKPDQGVWSIHNLRDNLQRVETQAKTGKTKIQSQHTPSASHASAPSARASSAAPAAHAGARGDGAASLSARADSAPMQGWVSGSQAPTHATPAASAAEDHVATSGIEGTARDGRAGRSDAAYVRAYGGTTPAQAGGGAEDRDEHTKLRGASKDAKRDEDAVADKEGRGGGGLGGLFAWGPWGHKKREEAGGKTEEAEESWQV